MQYICLGSLDEQQWETMSESEREGVSELLICNPA